MKQRRADPSIRGRGAFACSSPRAAFLVPPLLILACGLPAPAAGSAEADASASATLSSPSSHEPVSTLDLRDLTFDATRMDLFRSSSFFNPRTRRGFKLYRKFGDHYAARLYGEFAREVLRSHDVESFRLRLAERRDRVAAMAKSHRKLMISINVMPAWLSASNDQTPVEGWHTVSGTHRPKDYATWRALVATLVAFYGQFDVQMYYEVWNEPDSFYWQEGVDEYLELYAETAKAVKATDPRARVGGAAVNRWDGKVERDPHRLPLNLELIRYAGKHRLPLDFVSWHQFSRRTDKIRQAAETYRAALRDAGFAPLPELVVSEWNVDRPGRNSPVYAVLMADLLVTLHEAGVDLQMVAAWEDFHPSPDPDAYGLVSQDGTLKPVYHLHRVFDNLAREASGIAIVRQEGPNELEGDRRIVVADKGGGRYSIVLFEVGLDRPTAAAFQQLLDQGLTWADLRAYGSTKKLREAIRAGKPREPGHADAFRAARSAYEAQPPRSAVLELEITGAERIEVASAERIKGGVRATRVRVSGNRLTCDLDKNEVLVLELDVDWEDETTDSNESARHTQQERKP